MTLKTNTSYFLNYGRRQGKTTDLVELVSKQVKSIKNNTILILVANEVAKRELTSQLFKCSYADITEYHNTQRSTVHYKNNVKVLIHTCANIDKLRGISVDYLYVDEFPFFAEALKDFYQSVVPYLNIKQLVVTCSIDVKEIYKYRYLFNIVKQNFELIVKPVNVGKYSSEYQTLIKDTSVTLGIL